MQHRPVGLVADGPQHRALGLARLSQQGQRLVRMAGQHQLVKALGLPAGSDQHTLLVTDDALHWTAQALVRNARGDFFHILAGATGHRPPLRPVADLDQAVVVAKTDQGGQRELEHLVGRATPDAAQHGQQVPVAKGVGETLLAQEVRQRLHQFGIPVAECQGIGQPVEAQHIGQHAQKARAYQVAPLGKYGVER